MVKSVKPILIASAVICLPFLFLGGYFLYQEDMLTLKSSLLLLLATPFMVVVLIASTKGRYIVWDRKDLVEQDKHDNADS
jgi:hypothetical protein